MLQSRLQVLELVTNFGQGKASTGFKQGLSKQSLSPQAHLLVLALLGLQAPPLSLALTLGLHAALLCTFLPTLCIFLGPTKHFPVKVH